VPFIDLVWAARLAAFNELTFPVLLVLGLATRLATLGREFVRACSTSQVAMTRWLTRWLTS
jgi:hypothetical protein